MFIDTLKQLSLDELKQYYTNWLNTQNLSQNTIRTSKVDAFYIIKHNKNYNFWGMIESYDFEIEARSILKRTLLKYSKGNVQANITGYLAHLRRFRRFVYSDTELLSLSKQIFISSKTAIRKTKYDINISTPSPMEVDNYLNSWNTMENYRLQEESLDKLSNELAPNNKDLSDILIKTATLNDFYSTNIFSIYSVAKHIQSLDIDKRLDECDVTLVDDIKTVVIANKVKNFYSFATKYCSPHKPLEYPIYDSYVVEVLKYFREKDRFCVFINSDLKNFVKFKTVLEKFRTYYKLESYTLKEVDKYLWQIGKKYFPKQY